MDWEALETSSGNFCRAKVAQVFFPDRKTFDGPLSGHSSHAGTSVDESPKNSFSLPF
jgi:hypothetical protein